MAWLAASWAAFSKLYIGGIPTLGEHDLMLHVIIPRLGFGYVHCTELDTFHNLLSEVSGSLFLIMGGVDSAHTYRKKTPNYESVKFYSNRVMSAIHTSIWYHQLYYFVSFCVYIHLVYMDVNTNNNSMDIRSLVFECVKGQMFTAFLHTFAYLKKNCNKMHFYESLLVMEFFKVVFPFWHLRNS